MDKLSRTSQAENALDRFGWYWLSPCRDSLYYLCQGYNDASVRQCVPSGLCKAFSMYRVASKKDYEIVEGTCSAIIPKFLPKFRKIKITDDEGNETTLLLSKQSKVSIGERYRFYFKKTTRVTLGNEYFDSALS